MDDIFISYSRKDIAFARILNDMLKSKGLKSWIDWKDIPITAEWFKEVCAAIESANAFMFIISKTSIKSDTCKKEIDHAIKNNKRLIPIVLHDVDPKTMRKEVADLNWVFFREGQDNYQKSFDALIKAIQTDLEWVKVHTKLQVRALEWEKQKRDRSYLLRGKDLQDAEHWLAQIGADRNPQPTDLQRQYVLASRRDTDRRRRLTFSAVTAGLIIAMVLSVVAFVAQQAAQRSEQNAVEQQVIAEEQRDEAIKQARIAYSRQLAAQLLTQLDTKIDLALLLSIEAYRIADTKEARGSLMIALQYNHPNLVTFLHGHTNDVNSIIFSPEGKILASGSSDGTVILWDVTDLNSPSQIGMPLTSYEHDINSIAFSPDGKTLASGSNRSGSTTGTVILWDVTDLNSPSQIGMPLTGHEGWVNSITFSPDGKTLASGGGSGTVILWDVTDLNSPSQIGKITIDYYIINSITFSPDGKILASGSSDGTIILWDVTDLNSPSQIGMPLTGHEGWVNSITFSPDGKTLASGSGDGTVILWDVTDLNSPSQIDKQPLDHEDWVSSIAFSPNEKRLASGCSDGTIILWDLFDYLSSPRGTRFTGHEGWVSSVAFSPDGKILASGGDDDTIILWDVTDLISPSQIGMRLPYYSGSVNSVAFSPDGKILAASGGDDDTVIFWDVTDSNLPSLIGEQLTGHEHDVNSVAFSPDGKTLALGSNRSESNIGTITLWDVTNPNLPSQIGIPFTIYPTISHNVGPSVPIINSIAFSPEGKILTSGSIDGTIILWDITDLNLPSQIGVPLTGHEYAVNSVAFSPDGKTLASGSSDGTIILWDVTNPNLPSQIGMRLPYYSGSVNSVAFSPDGKTLASGSSDGTIILWDITDLNLPSQIGVPLTGHEYAVNSVAFSPDGKTLASGSSDGTIILWDIDIESWKKRLCQIANRNLTKEEWQQYIGDEPYQKTCENLP
jgi:WD40 repeat protein